MHADHGVPFASWANTGCMREAGLMASFGQIIVFGIEGTGSYGSALTSFLRRAGHKVVEVNRPDRRVGRMSGKSDTFDAEDAASTVLAGYATDVPKTADGAVGMIRQLKIAHDTAVEARAATMVTLRAVLVHALDELRHAVAGKAPVMLARHLAALRPRALVTPEDATRHALRSLARNGLHLREEARELEGMLEELVLATAPQSVEPFGIGATPPRGSSLSSGTTRADQAPGRPGEAGRYQSDPGIPR